MVEDGWLIRNKVIWAKTNPMPTSVRDRLSCTYEVRLPASRSQHYFFDLDAIRDPAPLPTCATERPAHGERRNRRRPSGPGPLAGATWLDAP